MKMKLHIIILLLGYLTFSGSICFQLQAQTEPGTLTIRVLTFNIKHGETMRGDFDLDLIAGVILKCDPDLVALQEVDFRTRRVQNMDLVLELACRTGMIPLFGRAMDFDGGAYGEGILSKYPLASSKVYPLDAAPQNEPRAALVVEINPGDPHSFFFMATHLDHTRDASDRISQARQINSIVGEFGRPAILAGDLNATPGSVPIGILETIWTATGGANPEPTYPSDAPVRKIDYIMVYPADRWRAIDHLVVDEKWASDHRPYLVTLELLPEK